MPRYREFFRLFLKPKQLFLWLIPRYFKWLPDRLYLKLTYRASMGKPLHLNPPVTFNEKLQWLKLYDRRPEYTKMVDKYEVRKLIEEKIGAQYLIPLLGVWNSADEIDFDSLPERFVLKCTHDSGSIIVCKDKASLDIPAIKETLKKSLKRKYYYFGREWPYKNAVPRIVAEQYMVDESGYELKDYKFFCFNGEAKIIQVDFDRFTHHKRNLYDTKWNLLNFEIQYPSDSGHVIPMPEKLNEMLTISSLLAKNIALLRVDLYIINNIVYFGETTFYHGSGMEHFTPECYDEILGSWIQLPSIKRSATD